MMNEEHFGTLTPRMKSFRDQLLSVTPQVDVERAMITTEVYREYQDQPLAIKRAIMLKKVLESMSIFIEPETMIAGNQASANRSAPIYPEYAMGWVIDELDEFCKRDGDVFTITEENKEKLRSIAPFWDHNTLQDRGLAAFPPHSKLFYDLGIIKSEGNITSGDAHCAVNYAAVLNLGLKDFKERAQRKLDELDLTDYRNIHKSYFYRAILIVVDAMKMFASRYAQLARTQANEADQKGDSRRAEELRDMAGVLDRVPFEPARTLHEDVQSVWLVHLAL